MGFNPRPRQPQGTGNLSPIKPTMKAGGKMLGAWEGEEDTRSCQPFSLGAFCTKSLLPLVLQNWDILQYTL